MTQRKEENIKNLELRAKLPRLFGFAALGLLVLTVLAVLLGFYRASKNPEFRMQGFPTSLSKDVVAEINGYERREMDGDIAKYYIRADRAISFADNHQELENVYLQVFDDTGTTSDQINANKAVYVPADNKNFTAYFSGAVNVATRDALNVKTEQLTYTKETEIATAEELIDFERFNIRGKSFGATVNVREKRLELLRDVQIQTFDSPELAQSGASSGRLNAGNAIYDQLGERIEFHNSMNASLTKTSTNGQPQTADVRSGHAVAYLEAHSGNNPTFRKIELFDDVQIDSRQADGKPTKIRSGYALYEKEADRFELKENLHIITVEDESPTDIRAASGVYEQTLGKIQLNGGAEITQGANFVRGDNIFAELFLNKRLKHARVLGNALVMQTTAERTTEVTGSELNAKFNEAQRLQNADVSGTGTAVLTPTVPAADYSKMTLSAQNSINVLFKNDGLLNRILTDGRTTVRLDVPDNSADAANKILTADTVKTQFNDSGQDMRTAEAIGNAELVVSPLRASERNYKTTINAPRFDCEFFPTGNNAKACVATTKTKTVRVPTQPAADRGTQTITADTLNAFFSPRTKDVERLDAVGKAKFSELDRNAISDSISFTIADETVRLRGGEPTIWDSRARARGSEIDWDTKNQTSVLRGGASTTYYSQTGTGGAAPFGKTDKPVFITAQTGEFDHKAETGVYTGNARAWQENNYVRGDRLMLMQKQGQLHVDGEVQSLLYNANRRENGKDTNVPVYVASKKLTFTRDSRLLVYETDVDIRQGKDRITSGLAKIYLTENNEFARTEMEKSVVITQPNRRAAGDYAQYSAAEEVVVLRGNPARVEDAENGTSQGAQMTVHLRENRVVGEGKSKQNASGRIRSVYKVKNQ